MSASANCQLRVFLIGGGGWSNTPGFASGGGGSGYLQYHTQAISGNSEIQLMVGAARQPSNITINGELIEAAPGHSGGGSPVSEAGDGYSGGGYGGKNNGGSNGANGDGGSGDYVGEGTGEYLNQLGKLSIKLSKNHQKFHIVGRMSGRIIFYTFSPIHQNANKTTHHNNTTKHHHATSHTPSQPSSSSSSISSFT